MKKNNSDYQIPDTFITVQSNDPLISPFWILHDKKIKKTTKLEKLFLEAHKVFRGRMRDLGNLDMETTLQDARAMQIMLQGLISAKRQIRKERGE